MSPIVAEVHRVMTIDAADPRIAEILRAGTIRVALFPSFFYAKNSSSGELTGIGIEIARALAARIGVEAGFREYASPPKAVQGLTSGECDVALLGLDPARAAEVDFSPAYMQADFTFLLPGNSAARTIADADQAGIRVGVVRDHAMDFALRGKLRHAAPVYAATPDAAFDLMRTQQVEVLAGIRPGLLGYAAKLAGSRVLDERYGANIFALAVPKGQAGWRGFVGAFVEDAKRSGLVARAIANAGLGGVEVASA